MVKETSETVITGDVNGLVETIISTLEMELKPDKYRLLCVANQYGVYKETSHYHDIIQEAPESAAVQKTSAATRTDPLLITHLLTLLISFLLMTSLHRMAPV
ncbi:uncharacterized protein LOC103508154 [Diaphorina citri]|uniref:Uncharacterized protein LOC103508154 n=1 Tax=Diaphorina citri TaxID=121845 RepID=A0A1S3CZB8_DIACI|nr:uncharacterized protein LOC103508154 [Diaphorina citri]